MHTQNKNKLLNLKTTLIIGSDRRRRRRGLPLILTTLDFLRSYEVSFIYMNNDGTFLNPCNFPNIFPSLQSRMKISVIPKVRMNPMTSNEWIGSKIFKFCASLVNNKKYL